MSKTTCNPAETFKTHTTKRAYLKFIDDIDGKLWEHTGTPAEEAMLRRETVVTSVAYVDGKPCVRYVANEARTEASERIKPTLEDAYIYALGGVKR